MNKPGLLTFSDDKKTVTSIFGELIKAASQRETYNALEKMRQEGQIDLPQLKDAMYEAMTNDKLPWDNPLHSQPEITLVHHVVDEEE